MRSKYKFIFDSSWLWIDYLVNLLMATLSKLRIGINHNDSWLKNIINSAPTNYL